MAAPEWLVYVGPIAGAIGTFSGIAGSIMGFISLRRSGKVKALDLRLELRKSSNELRHILHSLPTLLARAKDSRSRVCAASGQNGAMKEWLMAFEIANSSVEGFYKAAPAENADYRKKSAEELESMLVAVDALKLQVEEMQRRYQNSLDEDDKERENIRADMRARPQAR